MEYIRAFMLCLVIIAMASCDSQSPQGGDKLSPTTVPEVELHITQAQYETGFPRWDANPDNILVILMDTHNPSWRELCTDEMAGIPSLNPQGVAECVSSDF